MRIKRIERLLRLIRVLKTGQPKTVDDLDAAASASLKLESTLPAPIRDYCGPLMHEYYHGDGKTSQ